MTEPGAIEPQAAHAESKAAPPCVLVIFGITGDLTKRLLLPAIYNLAGVHALDEQFQLLGIGRRDWDDDKLKAYAQEALKEFWGKDADPQVIKWLTDRLSYVSGDFDDAALYDALRGRLEKMRSAQNGAANVLFYLAVEPNFIATIARGLERAAAFEEAGAAWRRLVIEKPFGHDLRSAIELTKTLHECVREEQIYRIDHFAGKDAVQDLAVFRFSNTVIEPLWNRALIDSVQITAAETVGVEGRADFYEKSGALRDMVPNHLAELLSLVAMEPPVSFTAQHMRAKQVELLESVKRIKPQEVAAHAVRAQYGAGTGGGQKVPGYRTEKGVDARSSTETFVAMKVEIDNWRWSGVPFFLRTGKRLAKSLTEIAVQFRLPPACLFPNAEQSECQPNRLLFNLQPSQGIHLTFGAKAPGLETRLAAASMSYQFPPGPFGSHAKGYERLLRDAMLGETILFQRAAFVEQGWRLVQPLLDVWSADKPASLPVYAAGSSGPKEADELLQKSGRAWRPLTDG